MHFLAEEPERLTTHCEGHTCHFPSSTRAPHGTTSRVGGGSRMHSARSYSCNGLFARCAQRKQAECTCVFADGEDTKRWRAPGRIVCNQTAALLQNMFVVHTFPINFKYFLKEVCEWTPCSTPRLHACWDCSTGRTNATCGHLAPWHTHDSDGRGGLFVEDKSHELSPLAMRSPCCLCKLDRINSYNTFVGV